MTRSPCAAAVAGAAAAVACPARGLARLAAGLAVLAALGCGRDEGGVVRIGVALPEDFAAPALLAAEDVNRAGGVHGSRLVIVRDSVPAPSPFVVSREIVLAQSVLREPVIAVLGHEGSGSSLAAAPVYNAAGVVQLVPTGTSFHLQYAGPWTLAFAPNDSAEGRFIADFARDRLHASSVVIFHSNDRYGIGLRDAVRAALRSDGLRVVDEVRFDPQADVAVLVAATLRRVAPDLVVIVGYAREAGLIAGALRALAYGGPIVAGDGAHALPALVRSHPSGAEGLYVVTFWLPGATDLATVAFEAAVRRRLRREPAARDAMAYDGMRLLATAIAEAGDSPGAVLAYLRSLGVKRPRFHGITGEIGFGAGAGRPRFVMGRVRGGVVVPVQDADR